LGIAVGPSFFLGLSDFLAVTMVSSRRGFFLRGARLGTLSNGSFLQALLFGLFLCSPLFRVSQKPALCCEYLVAQHFANSPPLHLSNAMGDLLFSSPL